MFVVKCACRIKNVFEDKTGLFDAKAACLPPWPRPKVTIQYEGQIRFQKSRMPAPASELGKRSAIIFDVTGYMQPVF